MLTELTLANFRLFSEAVTVRFRPITILIGRNSSGKSSIIKFLLMLQQSGPGYPQFLNPEGESVHLGAFQGLKNSLTEDSDLTFQITAESEVEPAFLQGLRWSKAPLDLDFTHLLHKTTASVPYSSSTLYGYATYCMMSASSGQELGEVKIGPSDKLPLWAQHPLPPGPEAEPVQNQEAEDTSEEMFAYFQTVLAHAAENVVISSSQKQVASLHHLPPVRIGSDRVIVSSKPPNNTVGENGQYTLPHLQKFTDEDSEKYEFIRPHVSRISDIEKLYFISTSEYTTQAFARSKTTGADVPIADYGFGVSQCLPVLVQGAIMDPQTTLMVEQPEAQLHPQLN